MIYFSIFGFYDLNLVENNTNLITLSHLHQNISRLTNNGKNSVFWPPSCTYDVMTYVTWQRQDDVTYTKMCLPSLVTDTMRLFVRLESSKKLQGKNARGVVPPGRPRVKATMKFGTELHMEVHNKLVLNGICRCSGDEDIQDGVRQPFWRILPFIKCLTLIEQRWYLEKTSQFRSWMTEFLQISLTILRNKIFKMAPDSHNPLLYFS